MRTSLRLTPLFVALAVPLVGCASLGGEFQTIRVESRPAGARVLVDGEPVGTTPTDIEVTSYEPHDVRLEMAGYPPREFRLTNSVNPLLFLNLALLGGAPYGLALDLATGSWNDYLTPSVIRARFADPATDAAGNIQSHDQGTEGRYGPRARRTRITPAGNSHPL